MDKRVLLIIGGGIAAYKALFLIRVLARRNIAARVILTKGGSEFVTALSAGGLSGDKVYTDLVVVAPATADLIAKAAHGIANDLATTTLQATDKRVLFAPAMNVRMWDSAATQRNIETLKNDGQFFIGPDEGEMACGEFGFGRMAEPDQIADAIEQILKGDTTIDGLRGPKPLKGKHALITAGPTREPIDPVRYLSNHSSGKQGYAIAAALGRLGATVTLISGPVSIDPPACAKLIRVETAREMLAACESAMPADIFVSVAAVADWRPKTNTDKKIKKNEAGIPALNLVENPDILAKLSTAKKRPELVIGFAAETHDVIEHARTKLSKKGCDWIVANDVSGDVMGGDHNSMIIVKDNTEETFPRLTKQDAARRLADRISEYFA